MPENPTPPTLIGHEQAVKTLNTLRQNNSFPHAILLHGPEGIGKRLLAEIAGKTLMCGSRENELQPNFLSPIYAQIESGSNADYHVIEPEKGKKSISIDQTRSLLARMSLSSDTPRVVIIDAAEDMTREAANALLKTLEEPQPNTHFFLVCHQISRLLPTIISRCRPIRLSPLSDSQSASVLGQHVTGDDLEMLLEVSRGCPGVALRALEQNLLPLQQDLAAFLENPSRPLILTEKIAKQKQIPAALDILQHLLAERPALHAEYKALAIDVQKMNELNLTPAWILEKALRSVMAAQSKLGTAA